MFFPAAEHYTYLKEIGIEARFQKHVLCKESEAMHSKGGTEWIKVGIDREISIYRKRKRGNCVIPETVTQAYLPLTQFPA